MQDVFGAKISLSKGAKGGRGQDTLRNTSSTFPFCFLHFYKVELLVPTSPDLEVLPSS